MHDAGAWELTGIAAMMPSRTATFMTMRMKRYDCDIDVRPPLPPKRGRVPLAHLRR